jgi:hypothetical protein
MDTGRRMNGVYSESGTPAQHRASELHRHPKSTVSPLDVERSAAKFALRPGSS